MRIHRLVTLLGIAVLCLAVLVGAAGSAHAQTAPAPRGHQPVSAVRVGSLHVPASLFAPDSRVSPVTWRQAPPLRLRAQSAPVQRSWMSRHPSRVGALIGLGVGAVVGAVLSRDTCFFHAEDTCTAASAVLFGGIGAGAGALVGLAF
jgi:hypothetical protein